MSVTIISGLAVSPDGKRLVLAAVFAGGCDFVAIVNCKAGGRAIVSAVLLTPGLADLNVEQYMHEGDTQLRFPVIEACQAGCCPIGWVASVGTARFYA